MAKKREVRNVSLFYIDDGGLLLDSETDLRETEASDFLCAHELDEFIRDFNRLATTAATGRSYSKQRKDLHELFWHASFGVSTKRDKGIEGMSFVLGRQPIDSGYKRYYRNQGQYFELDYYNPGSEYCDAITDASMLLAKV